MYKKLVIVNKEGVIEKVICSQNCSQTFACVLEFHFKVEEHYNFVRKINKEKADSNDKTHEKNTNPYMYV